ncbi:flagellar biosynthesis protein FlgM [Aphanothece hegewaldii CCALA 016]|uniref:Flagellar biosynthesis protein FlgM n=1 Tax=Aphanothece hegewaldii CCALA 016 TaxID=2107694 RepID=A0A2T1M094_9CHRO|nr:neutral zinc metallopeptidase [Aphanothece hegewaldii]PSF38096.1 flagellar biosynthesis protein FlgM [Aphanothece hegewaldii CCALA 016]
MRWQMGRRSGNVEDRRGMGMTPVVGGGLGAIVLALIALFLGIDPSIILESGINQQTAPSSGTRQGTPEEEPLKDFVSVVLADTEDVWTRQFRQMGREYVEPKLVLFSGSVDSACGYAQAAMGPFYCPRDQKVYIDLSFYRDLQNRHNAPGDFAQAYVLAHEVGHHVQTLLGISQQVDAARRRASETQSNQLSVRLELQADCLAGVWANQAQRERNILEQGDIEEALNAASQIGDDRLQSKARGYVVPDSFTHGTSEQRVRWFTRGIQSGDMNQCNTFATNTL